jgi:hypothetical protein
MTAEAPAVLRDLVEGVVAEISTLLPGLRACDGMVGPFDASELRRGGTRLPAVRVSLLGLKTRETRAGWATIHDASMAAYVVTGPRHGADRDLDALTIAEALLGQVPGATWGLSAAVMEAEGCVLRPLVTTAVRDAAASLMGVMWTQPVALRSLAPGATFPATLFVNGEQVTPEVNA